MIMTRNNNHQNGRLDKSSLGLTNLVSCSSVHSILAIKKGSVAKVLNVDSHGSPTRRLKELSSIYRYEDANGMDSVCSASWQTDRRKGSSGDCQVKLELTSPEEGDCPGKSNRIYAIDENQSIFHKNDADLETNHDSDELNGMTLKELKFRCKKQKAIKLDISGEAEAKNHTYVLPVEEHASSEPVEVESDLEEPLIVLKQKLSKKFKPERKRRRCTYPYSTNSVFSLQETYENKQSSCSSATQCPTSTDVTVGEHASSMNNAEEFHLINIKEEDLESDSHYTQTLVAFVECSASSSIADHNLSDCTISQVSEEAQGNDSETRGSMSMRSNILCNSSDEVSSSQNDKLKLGISEATIDICCHGLSSIQPTDCSSIRSPEVAYVVKKEILEPCSLNEAEEVNTVHCSAYDFIAKCHASGKLLNEAVESNYGYAIENDKPLPSENSQCYSDGEVSIGHPFLDHQISLQLIAGKDFDLANSFFPPVSGNSDPVSGAADYSSETSDTGKNTVSVKDITLETFETKKEHTNDVAFCTGGICSKSDDLIDTGVYNAECKGDDNSTYEVASQNMAMVRGKTDSDETNVSNGASSIKGEISVTIGNKELAGELATYIPGKIHSLRPREHSWSKSFTSCNSKISNLLSHRTGGLHSIDSCLDETEEKLMDIVDQKFCYLKSHGESTCFSGFFPPLDVDVLEATERPKFLSQMEMVMSSNEGKVSNQPGDILLCNDADRFGDGAPKYSSENPPIKLLSNRKALSPTSQEKLCQAVDAESGDGKKLQSEKRTNNSSSPESGDRVSDPISIPERMKFSGTGKRLWFEKRVNGNSFCESGQRASEQTLSSERTSKKTKTSSIPSNTKSILKSPCSIMKPCSCIESSLFHKHTQEAITFSQRQMHDIESLAMKLVKGLKSMKSVVEEASNSESCFSESSTYNTDKMKEAIDNASELEDTTKRWLSMMGRDCNRFCKILRSTMHKTAAPIDGLQKKRKKITFADEAGGTLCHVKVFEGHRSSSVDSEHEKVDPFAQATILQTCSYDPFFSSAFEIP